MEEKFLKTNQKKAFIRVVLAVIGVVATAGCEIDRDSGGGGIGKAGEGGGFLWKPVSESNGNLVVLLPNQYRGRVSSCHVADQGGGVIEEGVFTTDTHNGDRPHYRFTRPGGAYGNNLYVVADTEDGTVHWSIPNGASRTEY